MKQKTQLHLNMSICTHAKSHQLCLTLCDPMDYRMPGSSVHGILQARVLQWFGMPSSSGSFWPRDWTLISYVSRIGGQVLYHKHYLGSPNMSIEYHKHNHQRISKGKVGTSFASNLTLGRTHLGWNWMYSHHGSYIEGTRSKVIFLTLSWHIQWRELLRSFNTFAGFRALFPRIIPLLLKYLTDYFFCSA